MHPDENILLFTSSRTGSYFGSYGAFISPITIVSLPKIIAFWVVLKRPQEAQKIPKECPVMRLVFISAIPFEIVPDRAVDVAVARDAFLPVSLTVLGTPIGKMNRYLKNRRGNIPPNLLAEGFDCDEDEVLVCLHPVRRLQEEVDAIENREAVSVFVRQIPVP